MIWRAISLVALPAPVGAAMLVNEILKLPVGPTKALRSTGDVRTSASFVCDPAGNVSTAGSASVVVQRTVQDCVVDAAVSTVTTVTNAAGDAFSASTLAISRAGTAAVDAATRAVASVGEAANSLKRQVTNEDRIEALREEAEDLSHLENARQWADSLKAMFAVGISMAAADGEISDVERMDILECAAGLTHEHLPTALQGAVQLWLASPPTIEQAFALASGCGERTMAAIEHLMEIVIHSDGVEHPAETAFRDRWRSLRQAAKA
jgi:hypothetical protein